MERGARVASRFEIAGPVGSGGMGEVFRALDLETGEPVAIKRLGKRGREPSAGSDREARFEREAAILASLRHPHVVRYVAHGVDDDGERFLAMEWLEGEDLDARLDRGPLPIDQAVTLAIAVSEAAGAAHEQGIVHRDIKPGNVWLSDREVSRAKLLDFGVARAVDRDGGTRIGMTLGTPAYMAPEQARGSLDVDARADVFSIACVLFHCLVGRPPIVADSALALLAKIILESAPRVRDLDARVPAPLDELLAQALAKDRNLRPADGHAFAAALRAVHGDDATLSLPTRAAPGGTSRPPGSGPALTSDEQRLLGVVLASPPSPHDPRAGLPTPTGGALAPLEAEITASGGRLDELANGSLVITVLSERGVTEQAAQVARCALRVHARAPWLAVSVATGRGTLAGRLPVGEVIERAARRLTATSRTDRIYLDDVTAGLLEGRFQIGSDDSGATLIHGEASAVEGPAPGARTRCVGRDAVIRRLSSVVQAAFEDARGTSVIVTGAAGVGKSRVLEEALEEVGRRSHEARRWTARGNPMAAGAPYGLVVELLRDFVGLDRSAPTLAFASTLGVRIASVAAPADQERVVEFILELCGAPVSRPSVALRAARSDPFLMGDQLRRAFGDLCAGVARVHPLLLVLEDLQWGDIPSVRCLEEALARGRELPLCVIGLTRPEQPESLLGTLRERAALDLTLAPLTKRAAAELARESLGAEAADELVHRIVERGQQNPFFMGELVRAAKAGRTREVPETVLALVQARIERSTPERRRILRAASIFGARWTAPGLEALLGGEPAGAALRDELRALADDDLVTVGPPSPAGVVDYAFSHDLLREAAYRMLTDDDRALGHNLAAAWLVTTGEAEPLAMAEHLERSGEPERAAGWYRTAAEQALGGSDLAAVLARAERGLACGAVGEDRGVLCLLAAEAHNWLGHTNDALALAQAAADAHPTSSPFHWRAVGELASCLGKMGAYDDLVSRAGGFDADIEVRSAGAAVIAAVRVLVNLLQAGRVEPAERLLARATELYERGGEHAPASMGWLFRARASHALVRGDPDAYRRYNEQAVASFTALGDERNAAMPRVNVGYGYGLIGAYPEAVETLQNALAVARRVGLPSVESFVYVNLQLPLARVGRLAEAREVGDRTEELGRAQKNPRVEAFASIYRAIAELEANDPDEAVARARAAMTAAERVAPVRLFARGVLVRALVAKGDLDEARAEGAIVEEAIDALGKIDAGDALVRLACIEARAATGDAEGARRGAVEACDRLIDSAARIADAESRERFLREVPEHARTLELAHELSRRRAESH